MSEKRRRRLKRHESLQPLSRHHMEALHLALKLRRAGTEKSDLTLEELQQELKNFWEPNGQEHFREEEEILLPTYAQYKDINQPEIIEMLLEHVEIRSLVKQILAMDDIDETVMHKLGELLDAHVRKEERIIFERIQKELPEDVLIELEPYLHD
ncbi:MAG TPA: hemerythrin domain-containing protein [Bacillota bacterium]|nr:hemerythrin domain-containing protein [Bacillota bacterium]